MHPLQNADVCLAETGQPARANEAMAVRMRIHEKTTLSRLLVALENGTIDCCGVDSAAT